MLFKVGSYRKVHMTIRDREDHNDFDLNKERFLNNIRWQFALCNVMEKLPEKIKEEDGVKYVYSGYNFVINSLDFSTLKNYISNVMEFMDFTAEIEE